MSVSSAHRLSARRRELAPPLEAFDSLLATKFVHTSLRAAYGIVGASAIEYLVLSASPGERAGLYYMRLSVASEADACVASWGHASTRS